jgi:clan AA aspartic protease
MNRLPFPGGQLADSEMGHFRVTIDVGHPVADRFVPVEALVDTGSTFTWIPRNVLQNLGAAPEEEWPFELADGSEVRYPVAWLLIRLNQRVQPSIVVFGESGSEPILGVVTLEEFRLAVDPVNRRLMAVPGRL